MIECRTVNLKEPTIIPRSHHSISRNWISPNAVRVLYRLKEAGYKAYLVGGGVRDLLLGREPKDFDIATDARPNEVKKVFRNCRLIGRRFRLAHIHFHDEIIEVATFRSNVADIPIPAEAELPPAIDPPCPAESAPAEVDGAPAASAPPITEERPKPPRLLMSDDGMILRDNLFGAPDEDAVRRDFTVNALFYNIADYSVIDYVDGIADLRAGLIRIIGDPIVRFTEDPVRMVRAVRFAAMLGFEIERETYAAIIELKDRIALASPARMYEETLKLFLLGEGEKTYQLLRKTGMFAALFPALNEWVDRERDGFPHVWLGKAFEWVDTCVQSGRKVEPHILFGLMFGQYIEEKTELNLPAANSLLDAMNNAVSEALAEHAPHVLIPKRISFTMRDMYWNQTRFERRTGKYPRYFMNRPGFAEAWEYLRFRSEVTGDGMELRAWWKTFLGEHAIQPGLEQKTPEAPRQKRPVRRRRRRRRPGAPDAASGPPAGSGAAPQPENR